MMVIICPRRSGATIVTAGNQDSEWREGVHARLQPGASSHV